MLISGDFFDHNRIDVQLSASVAALLEQADIPVVVLPGNHAPYTVDSVYRRLRFLDNVLILREAAGELLLLPELGVQVWGQAHTDYLDFAPLGALPTDDLQRLGAHYVGLGHLEHHEQIGEYAYYAGAPERSGGATCIDLAPCSVAIRHEPFAPEQSARFLFRERRVHVPRRSPVIRSARFATTAR